MANVVKYLGIKIKYLLYAETVIKLNLTPVINDVQKQFEKWQMLRISWFGRMAVIKMKVLPRFVSVFWNLILPWSVSILNRIQRMFSKFMWEGKKLRIKAAIMQQNKAQGGVVFPNIMLYYQAALLLECILQ